MSKFEIFIDQPIKIEIEASSYQEAIAAIKAQFHISDIANVKFSEPIVIELEEEVAEEVEKEQVETETEASN